MTEERISQRDIQRLLWRPLQGPRPHQIINTGVYLLFMLRVREIVEELKVFERNKVPFEVKIPGIVTLYSDVFSREDC